MGKRNKLEIKEDRITIVELYRKGYTLKQIATEVSSDRPYSISYVTVHKELEKVFRNLNEELHLHISGFLASAIQEYRQVRKNAWADYLFSKKARRTVKHKRRAIVEQGEIKPLQGDDKLVEVSKMTSSPAVEISEEIIQEQERPGSPAHLRIYMDALEKEAKLLGFFNKQPTPKKPQKIIVVMPENRNDYTSDRSEES